VEEEEKATKLVRLNMLPQLLLKLLQPIEVAQCPRAAESQAN
jgi:hypothetical protein